MTKQEWIARAEAGYTYVYIQTGCGAYVWFPLPGLLEVHEQQRCRKFFTLN